MRLLFFFISIAGMFYSIFVIAITRIDTGALAILFVSFLFMTIAIVYHPLRIRWKKNKTFRVSTLSAVSIALIIALCLEGLILSSIKDDHPADIDYVLVLGAGIKDGKPSRVLKERLDKASEYLHEHPHAKVAVSGGLTDGERETEAEAMGKYLKNKGVPSGSIVYEHKATSTYENIKFSQELMKKYLSPEKEQRVLIISSDFHLHRAKCLAEDIGLKAFGQGSSVPLSVTPQVHVREILALAKYYVMDKNYF
ncbi:YdcF family protein [Fictibacillus terranigra]|uniref:YdcF family protein n=1 Tax=Fictibacillus terranigra TaxID=3058424 RepID=A0ABT8E7L7_9BACL|nr:YdcF family protein [Fictibacillus sp. CENA-BCM004]MDN4073918.1 YdcF family protein [Fictibacillus sp. CENA-BCM004]